MYMRAAQYVERIGAPMGPLPVRARIKRAPQTVSAGLGLTNSKSNSAHQSPRLYFHLLREILE